MNITSNEEEIFALSVENWIQDGLDRGITSFGDLVAWLPGVDPRFAFDTICRLVSTQRASAGLLANSLREPQHQQKQLSARHAFKLPVPHPLDYGWRFSEDAAEALLALCRELSQPNGHVLMLGTPSVLRLAAERGAQQPITLLDADSSLLRCFGDAPPLLTVYQRDLLYDPLPDVLAQVVLLDPPWYAQHLKAFLWVASQLCDSGGHIIMSAPPKGTRPGIENELVDILTWARELGLTLVTAQENRLSYTSPLFELNALGAAGLHNIPQDWRRGTVLIFVHEQWYQVPRPDPPQPIERWTEAEIRGVRIRVRHSDDGDSQCADPRLVTIVPGDILSSVSRRDVRRQLIQVWTAGNRVFGCCATGLLSVILGSLERGVPPNQIAPAVSTRIGRALDAHEWADIQKAIRQVQACIALEQQEVQQHGDTA